MSVTTVLSFVAKFGLPAWYGRLAAEAAIDRLPWLARCARVDPCNATGEDACGQCRACAVYWLTNRGNAVRDEAGDRGSRIHEAAEQTVLFGEGATVDGDIAAYVAQYQRWREVVQPQVLASEVTVISRKWGYAGTLDGIWRLPDPEPLAKHIRHLAGRALVADIKTGRSVGIPEGWQVTAYARADAVLLPDGSEEPMPPTEGGLILHVRPDKVQMREVFVTDANHAAFVHELRVAEALGAGLNTVLSRPANLPKGP